MEKFVLKIDPDFLSGDKGKPNKKFHELIMLGRHFTSAEIRVEKKYFKKRLMDVIERYGRRLINLKVVSEVLTSQDMLEILRLTPKLEELAFRSVI